MKKVLFLTVTSLTPKNSIELRKPSIFQNVIYNFDLGHIKGIAEFQYNGYIGDESGKFNHDLEFIDINELFFNGEKITAGYGDPEWEEFKKSFKLLFKKDIFKVIEEGFKNEVNENEILEHIKRRLLCE